MAGERVVYSTEQLDHWNWLTTMGEPIWNRRNSRNWTVNTDIRENAAFYEMTQLIGQPSLEAMRYLWSKFSTHYDNGYESQEVAAISGVFYYYFRESDQHEGINFQERVVLPIETAVNPKQLSWEWIEKHQDRLGKEWEHGPVSFGISGDLHGPFEWEKFQTFNHGVGDLGEAWFKGTINSYTTGKMTQKFLAFADLDTKIADEELMKLSQELGSPFWVAETTRGYHLIFPIKFKAGSGPIDRNIEVPARIGLATTTAIDRRNLFRWQVTAESVIRVTAGLNRDSQPRIVAVVWDGNTLVRA